MKITNPASWALVLALLSTPVASQVSVGGSCNTHSDCPVASDGQSQYCASDGFCTNQGGCAAVSDCSLPENSGFMMAACVGTTICENRSCGIRCDGAPIPENAVGSCSSHNDCLDKEYCASDGKCERMGGCAVVEDCYLAENSGYPVAPCTGSMKCQNRECSMSCTGSDALFSCDTTSDCPGDDMYCNIYGICMGMGTCVESKDCDNFENVFPEIACVGTRYCENAKCGKVCDGGARPPTRPQVAPAFCTTTNECPVDMYCSGSGNCLPFGGCDAVPDCKTLDNEIVFPACVGTIFCTDGQCGKTCDGVGGGSSLPDLCASNVDCPVEGSYCAGNGLCLKSGYCDREADCTAPGNDIAFPACVGTISCTNRQCGKVCDGDGDVVGISGGVSDVATPAEPTFEDKENEDNVAPVNVTVISCVTDADCNGTTTATTRSVLGEMYCASGVCTEHGSCFTDEDCINPANFLFNDKRCMGYLYCNTDGLCDRECGTICKNGSRSADCYEDECGKIDLSECAGAVSCTMSTCDEKCSVVLFDASGNVLPGCTPPDVNLVSPHDAVDPNSTKILRNNIESSAARATSALAILAALTAVVLV